MPHQPFFERALADGARRSREASALPQRPGQTHDPAGPVREAPTPEVLWRRFKWPIIGLGLFLLIELVSLSKLIGVMGRHF